jgi:hypothetical protein
VASSLTIPSRTANGLAKAAALSFFAAAGLILASPGSAEAAACNTTSYSIANLTTGGFGCTIGDRTYSNFAFNTGISNANKLKEGSFTFSIDPSTFDHIFSGSGLNYSGTGFNYQYQVALTADAPIGQEFKAFNTGYSGSSTTSSSYKFKKVMAAYTTGGALISGGTLGGNRSNAQVTAQNVVATVPGIGSINGVVTDGPYTFAGGEIGPIVFKNTVTRSAAGGRIDVITDSITQLITPGQTTGAPAPLPILGAGAALGLSRKLRRRIKLA